MQIWLQEYAVSYHRAYIVAKSNKKERYVVICEDEDCAWKVRARKTPEGRWKKSSYEGPHTCGDNVLKGGGHRQLTSTYAPDSDDDRPEAKFSEKEIDAFVKVWRRHPSIHEFNDVREAHLAITDLNLRSMACNHLLPSSSIGQ